MKVRNAFTLIGATLLCLQGGSALLAQEGPPAPLPLEPVSFPKFHEAKLSNGAQAIIVENHEQPMVTVNLRIKSGTAFDPPGREGLAGATASLLDKGTTSRNALEVAEAIDFMGASIGAGAGEDWTSVTATALTEFLEPALEIMADMVINPTFPTDELEIERKRFLTGLKLELSDPGSVAQRQFIQGLYGKHPYGSLPTVASVEGMTREDIVAFHRSYYRPDNSLFVIAGAVDPDEMVKRLNKHFGKWKSGKVESVAMAAPPTREGRKIRFYHKPGSVQANVLVGHLIEPATDPDWPALDVALRIFGGGSQGWLYRTLREEKGYTYGSYASGAKRISRGYVQASAEVRNEVADSSLQEMFTLLERLRSEPVPAADLTLAKDYITGSFPREIETPQQVAGQIATTRLHRLPQDYLEKYRTRVAAVDAKEVQRVATKHLKPDQALVVVVGDATQIYDKVVPFGSIELYDVEGNAITLADLEIKAAEIALDATTIQPITLIYSLNVQGNPVGEITTAVTRESLEGRDVVRSQTTGGAMGMVLEQDVVFTAETFTGITSHISQKMGAQGVEIDMQLSEGVVSGSVTGMSGETREVSTEVVEGTLLPGMDDYVIWLADLGANAEFEVPAVNPTTGSPYTLKVKVLGETTVTVAAGEFEAYELEVSAAEGSATIHARKAAPHIVLKQAPAAQPLVIELKEIR